MQSNTSVRRNLRPLRWMAALAGAVMMATPIAATAGGGGMVLAQSEWRNPKNTVHIRLRSCGQEKLCGVVIWATDKAKADARRGGTENLVGLDLFREFHRVSPGQYKGRVFVPDMNRTFSGQMKLQGNSMIGKGCVLGGLFCKQQVWTRIS